MCVRQMPVIVAIAAAVATIPCQYKYTFLAEQSYERDLWIWLNKNNNNYFYCRKSFQCIQCIRTEFFDKLEKSWCRGKMTFPIIVAMGFFLFISLNVLMHKHQYHTHTLRRKHFNGNESIGIFFHSPKTPANCYCSFLLAS